MLTITQREDRELIARIKADTDAKSVEYKLRLDTARDQAWAP